MPEIKYNIPKTRHTHMGNKCSFLVRFLLSKNIAKTQKQASLFLIIIAIILLVATIILFQRDGRAPIQETVDLELQEQYSYEAKQQ